jgi:nitrate reductase NapD
MIFSGSLITIKDNTIKEVKEFLKKYSQIDIYTTSEDETQLVVAIEEESDSSLEELCFKISKHPDIINIAHHYFHFEEEVDKALKGEFKPDLNGFGKKKFKKIIEKKEKTK